ncbi:uncharacterized protein LOC113236295 [Hyposmocoma kahamanoa]|uniref:uncharacterized protein LOC113236295 n=1 Tax=Hyposmocoma kahamanoa TaxID=1477025 RepID=UPI000E6D92E9|nr:uncharacterized protein LOC113236295 [Hyposmocoma kahamanoa]
MVLWLTSFPSNHDRQKKISTPSSGRGATSNPWELTNCYKLKLLTYNIQSLSSDDGLVELETELGNVKWDILRLYEIRRNGEELLTLKSGHILYYREGSKPGIEGIGFMVNQAIKDCVVEINSISYRLAYVILRLSKMYKLKVIQAYAPTLSHLDETVEEFYEDLRTLNDKVKTKYTIIMGDFNARVGTTGSDHRLVRADICIKLRTARRNLIVKKHLPADTKCKILRVNEDLYKNAVEAKINHEQLTTMTVDVINDKLTAALTLSLDEITPSVLPSQPSKLTPENIKMMHQRRSLCSEGKIGSQEYRNLQKQIRIQTRNDMMDHNTRSIQESLEKNNSRRLLKLEQRKLPLWPNVLECIFQQMQWTGKGLMIDGERLTNLRFADDMVLISESIEYLLTMLEDLRVKSEKTDLKMNIGKTKIMTNIPEVTNYQLPVEKVTEYIYLGYKVTLGFENQTAEVERRVVQAWAAFGANKQTLCGKIPLHLKVSLRTMCHARARLW